MYYHLHVLCETHLFEVDLMMQNTVDHKKLSIACHVKLHVGYYPLKLSLVP
jgi:hypothetical protein